jgi:hypothetical protein
MSIDVTIKDRKTGNSARVDEWGRVVTGLSDFSTFFPATASVDDTGVTIVPPLSNKRFVVTGIIITADKSVTSEAVVTVYEASAPNSNTEDKVIFTTEILKQRTLTMLPLNIILTEGKWLIGKTDDNNALFNVSGFYVDAN